MATGGMGDTLAGMITSFVGQFDFKENFSTMFFKYNSCT
jgi:NAD(P)H-hydrate repair Nnr-like enzyme with NAD(P)H-hydrate dehydratase domain